MILVVTLNPCIDRTLTLEKLIPGGHNSVEEVREDVSGKGINVNVVLQHLGVPSKAVGFEFTRRGRPVQEFLASLGIPFVSVSLNHDLRVNTKVFDRTAMQMTEINCRGPQLTEQDAEAVMELFAQELNGADMLVVDGSVPPGIPTDIYARMITLAKDRGIASVLDTSGSLLREGLKAGPTLVKPNLLELGEYTGHPLKNREEILQACRDMIARGVHGVCVSMGGDGALYVEENGAWYSPGLDIRVLGFQGAGDSMVAGMCAAWLDSADGSELLRSAVAAAHGSLLREGTLLCTKEQYEDLLKKIPVERIE